MENDHIYALEHVEELLREQQDGQTYYALLSFIEGKATTLVMRETDHSGILAWKLLVDRYTVSTQRRTLS